MNKFEVMLGIYAFAILMLQFTDLISYKHSIELSKVTNVVIRPQNSDFLVAFHFGGSHVVTAAVDKKTAGMINYALSKAKVLEYIT